MARFFAPRSVKILDGGSAGAATRKENVLFAPFVVFDVLSNIVRCDS